MTAASAHKVSIRLFIQAAFTGLLAVADTHSSTWMLVALAVAVGAAVIAAAIRSNPTNARGLVIGFEALAVAVGVIGLRDHHYIPGTIVGVATLITVLGGNDRAAATPPPPLGPPPAYPPSAGPFAPPPRTVPPQQPARPPQQRVVPPATDARPRLPHPGNLPDA